MFSNNAENLQQLWNCINTILHRGPAETVPIHVSIKASCDSFSSHFKSKISLIRSAFRNNALNLNPVHVDYPQANSQLASFTTATVDEVRKIIMSSQISPVIMIHYRLHW